MVYYRTRWIRVHAVYWLFKTLYKKMPHSHHVCIIVLFYLSLLVGIPMAQKYTIHSHDTQHTNTYILCNHHHSSFIFSGNYSKSRQEFQDKIVEKLLDGTAVTDATNGRVCKTPTEPWIVFTAGVMVRSMLCSV